MDYSGVFSDVYVSRTIHACALIFDPSQPILIAFASGSIPRGPAAIELAEKYRLNCVSVSCRALDWFQYSDLEAAEFAIADFTRAFPKRVLYGFSMGGYAALLTSKALNADIVLACSPQAAIGPNIPAGEYRWANERARIDFELGFPNDHLHQRITESGEIIVLYDPRDFDKYHARMIEQIRPIKKLYFPFAGHATLPVMAQLGLTSKLVVDVMSSNFKLEAFQKILHEERRKARRIELLVAEMHRRGKKMPLTLLNRFLDLNDLIDVKRTRIVMLEALKQGETDITCRAVLNLINIEGLALTKKFPGIDYTIKSSPSLSYFSQPQFVRDIKQVAPLIVKSASYKKCLNLIEELISISAHKSDYFCLSLAKSHLLRESHGIQAAVESILLSSRKISAWDQENIIIAETLSALGAFAEASAYQKRASLLDEADFAGFDARARGYERNNDWKSASQIWAEAYERKIDLIRVSVRYARALSRLGDYKEALEKLAPALEIPKVSLEVRKMEANFCQKLGLHDQAIVALNEMLEAEPLNPTYHRSISNSYLDQGNLLLAIQHAKFAAELLESPSNTRHVDKISRILNSSL